MISLDRKEEEGQKFRAEIKPKIEKFVEDAAKGRKCLKKDMVQILKEIDKFVGTGNTYEISEYNLMRINVLGAYEFYQIYKKK